jgi:hypothetical protein
MLRPISEIARDIANEWKDVHYTARPYLLAMTALTDKKSKYGADDAPGIILYFLSNAGSFRGGKAPALKAELKQHLK